MKLIDADALERDGWQMSRTVRIDKDTMEWQTREPTDFPTVDPYEWIPVTEALPRDDEEVIVTCLDDSGDTPYSYTTTAWHYKGMWVCDNMRCPFVIAWMPQPKPWKGDRND